MACSGERTAAAPSGQHRVSLCHPVAVAVAVPSGLRGLHHHSRPGPGDARETGREAASDGAQHGKGMFVEESG